MHRGSREWIAWDLTFCIDRYILCIFILYIYILYVIYVYIACVYIYIYIFAFSCFVRSVSLSGEMFGASGIVTSIKVL